MKLCVLWKFDFLLLMAPLKDNYLIRGSLIIQIG